MILGKRAWGFGAAPCLLFVAHACEPNQVPNVDLTCESYASAYCGELATCSNAVLEERWGQESVCVEVITLSCVYGLNAPSTGETAARRSACAADISSWACSDLIDGINPPSACAQAVGPLADGAPCSVAGQCQTGFCSQPWGSDCGTCAPVPQPGASCAGGQCASGQLCVNLEGSSLVCAPHPAINEACGGAMNCNGVPWCDGNLSCIGAAPCGLAEPGAPPSEMTCLPDPSDGGACDFTGAGCDESQGLVCNASGRCQPLTLAQPGEACGLVEGAPVPCAGGRCVDGVCQALLPLGSACVVDAGAPCIGLTVCLAADGGSDGICAPHGAFGCPSGD